MMKIRLLGGALGALVSAGAAFAGALTIILGIVGVVGIPVGAVIGFALAPRIVRAASQSGLVLVAALAAVPLGTFLFALPTALAEGRGASVLEVVGRALEYSIALGLFGVVLGFPMALIVAAIAAHLLRRLAPRVDRWWVPASVVLGLVAVMVAFAVASAIDDQTDRVAEFADRVGFTYRVDNLSDRERLLEVRTYWRGVAG